MANQLSDQQKAERVLSALGRAPGMLGSFPADVQKELSALCGEDGFLIAGKRDDAEKLLTDYWDAQKATVEESGSEALKQIARDATEFYEVKDG